MDNTVLLLIIIPPIFAGLGYIIKFFIDKSYKKIYIINKNKLENIEFKLKKFFFPIYTNLLRENTIWNKILNVYTSEDFKIIFELDKEILSSHLENQKIIHEHITSINPSQELLELLNMYDEHVTVYNILRKIEPNIDPTIHSLECMKYPGNFHVPYPIKLTEIIYKELNSLREKQKNIYKSIV